jgi:hypothetical protein
MSASSVVACLAFGVLPGVDIEGAGLDQHLDAR